MNPKKTPVGERKREKARKAAEKLIMAHMGADEQKLFKQLSGDVDLHLLYKALLVDLAQLNESFATGDIAPGPYYKRKLEYIDMLRKLASTAEAINESPVEAVKLEAPPVEANKAWFFDSDGRPIDPETLRAAAEQLEKDQEG